MGAIGLASRLDRSLTQTEISLAKQILAQHLQKEGLKHGEDFEIVEVDGLIPLTKRAAQSAPKREESVLLLKALNTKMLLRVIGLLSIHERLKRMGN